MLTDTLVFAVDVLQVEAIMTLADVTPERVDAFAEARADAAARGALVHI